MVAILPAAPRVLAKASCNLILALYQLNQQYEPDRDMSTRLTQVVNFIVQLHGATAALPMMTNPETAEPIDDGLYALASMILNGVTAFYHFAMDGSTYDDAKDMIINSREMRLGLVVCNIVLLIAAIVERDRVLQAQQEYVREILVWMTRLGHPTNRKRGESS